MNSFLRKEKILQKKLERKKLLQKNSIVNYIDIYKEELHNNTDTLEDRKEKILQKEIKKKFDYNNFEKILNNNSKIFIYYSKNSWNLLFQRPHQICRFMDKEYLKIFITCDNTIIFEEKNNLLVIPYSLNFFYKINNYKEKIIYFTDTRLYNEIKEFNNFTIIYDLIDAPIEEFAIWKPLLKDCVLNSDIILYSHPKLINFLNEIDNTKEYYYISNACDYKHFSKSNKRIGIRPKEFPNTNKPILGYYGAFAKWLDYDLIKKYADENKYHIVMIGGIKENKDYNISFEHKNITWIDHKSYEELPYYLSWFDVCFLPFKKCELNEYVNPCKLWEYMASGKEIIKYGINIEADEIIKYEDIINNIKILCKRNIFKYYNIKEFIISDSLKHLKNRIKKFYKLNELKKMNLLYFGLYSLNDIIIIKKYNIKNLMFGGSDIDLIFNNPYLKLQFDQIENKVIFSISINIKERLLKYGYESIYINFNIVDYSIFKKTKIEENNNIFIYNGITKGNEHLYGKNIYDEIIKYLPNYNYIFSNELNNISNDKMYDIYKKCFIGLRLTDKDGNANMVQEMTAMNIPVIHNGEQGGIFWKNKKDIINIINKYSLKLLNINSYNFFKINNIDENILKNVKYNIKIFYLYVVIIQIMEVQLQIVIIYKFFLNKKDIIHLAFIIILIQRNMR